MLTRDRIVAHCAFMAERDRDYAEWAWRQYAALLPWLITPARAFAGVA